MECLTVLETRAQAEVNGMITSKVGASRLETAHVLRLNNCARSSLLSRKPMVRMFGMFFLTFSIQTQCDILLCTELLVGTEKRKS